MTPPKPDLLPDEIMVQAPETGKTYGIWHPTASGHAVKYTRADKTAPVTEIKGLDEALGLYLANPNPASEESGDAFAHAWFEFQAKYSCDPEEVIKDAATRYAALPGQGNALPEWKPVQILTENRFVFFVKRGYERGPQFLGFLSSGEAHYFSYSDQDIQTCVKSDILMWRSADELNDAPIATINQDGGTLNAD